MPKITIRDSVKDFHVFSGPEIRFFLRDNVCEIVDFGGGQRRILGSFTDYIFVKEDVRADHDGSFDSLKPRANMRPPEHAHDPFTVAAIAGRDPDAIPDFNTLKDGAPIDMPEPEPKEEDEEPALPGIKDKIVKPPKPAPKKKGRRATDKN